MKKLLLSSLVICSMNIVAMDAPPAAAAAASEDEKEKVSAIPPGLQVEQDAHRAIILQGTQTELHRISSLLWAYMHPAKNRFTEQGLEFPHYKHEFFTYPMSWKDALAEVQYFRAESKETADEQMKALALNLLKQGPAFRFALIEKLVLLKSELKLFEEDKDTTCITDARKTNRAAYRQAFNASNWQNLPELVNKELHCPEHAMKNLTALAEAAKSLTIFKMGQEQSEGKQLMQLLTMTQLARGALAQSGQQIQIRVVQSQAEGQMPSNQQGQGGGNCILL